MKTFNLFAALAALTSAFMTTAPAQAAAQPIVGQIIAGKNRPNRVTIISAFSCPFCKAFDRQAGVPAYLEWQRRGYEVEFISVVAFPSDRYSSALVQCTGMKGYLARQRRLFEAQSMIALAPESHQRKQALELADAMQIPRKAAEACLSPAALKREEARTERAKQIYNYGGTPSSYINGKFVGNGFGEVNAAVRSGRR